MPLPKTGVTHHHTQLGIPVKDRAIKVLFDGEFQTPWVHEHVTPQGRGVCSR